MNSDSVLAGLVSWVFVVVLAAVIAVVGLVWTDDEGVLAMMYESAMGSSSKPEDGRLDMSGLVKQPEEIRAPTDEHIPVVLYVEDNLANAQLIERLLARLTRARLLTAMQGSLGLELAASAGPDVILLDLHLPDMSGGDVLRRLRADSRTAQTPVVVISADATPGRVARLLADGATAYLPKPVDVVQFFDVLRPLLVTPPREAQVG